MVGQASAVCPSTEAGVHCRVVFIDVDNLTVHMLGLCLLCFGIARAGITAQFVNSKGFRQEEEQGDGVMMGKCCSVIGHCECCRFSYVFVVVALVCFMI